MRARSKDRQMGSEDIIRGCRREFREVFEIRKIRSLGGWFYARLLLGIGCIAAGVLAGQTIDQRLMLVAMFPAVALLSGVIAKLTAPRPPKITNTEEPQLSAAERHLLAAVWNAGELRTSEAAEKVSLSEEETADTLSSLAERGYLSVREADGETVYGRAGR